MQTVRIGLLGLGRVGQAVLRAAQDERHRFARLGLHLEFTSALVRDVDRPRTVSLPRVALTADADEFLARPLDLVIDVLGGLRPAGRIVRRLLERGTPVVTANKALLAVHGRELLGLAAARGVALRGEASMIAGVPLLRALRTRPFAARVERLEAILNGTSNFVLSAIEREGRTVDQALALAQRLGYAEPDAQRDLSGRDAADKLAVLLQHFGHAAAPADFEVTGLDGLTAVDLRVAREFGGVIKPLAAAEFSPAAQTAFVGPAFVPGTHPLAGVDREQNGIRFEGPETGVLFFSGPGPGPDLTASAILDDVIETALGGAHPLLRTAAELRSEPGPELGPDSAAGALAAAARPTPAQPARSGFAGPVTPWFVRFESRGLAPSAHEAADFLATFGLWFARRGARHSPPGALHGLTLAAARPQVVRALNALADATGGRWYAIRALENPHAD